MQEDNNQTSQLANKIQFFPESGSNEIKGTSSSFLQNISDKTDSVLSFIKSKNPLTSISSISSLSSITSTLETTQPKLLNLEPISEATFIDFKSKSRVINCKEAKKTQLNDTTIISTLQNPKVMDKGYFDNYIIYEIKTEQFKWLVTRRYSDFIWLRQCLTAHFPGELMPQMPGKKMGNRRFEDDFVQKRMKSLQVFLDNINQNELFKTNEALVLFLSCSDRVLFEFQMKAITPTALTINSISNITSFTGNIEVIDFDNDCYISHNNYYMNMNNYFKLQEETLTKLTKNLDDFYNSMANAMLCFKEIESNFNTLNMINARSNVAPEITNSYEQFEIFIKNWKRILIQQTVTVKERIHDFFKDINKSSRSFTELINKQEELRNEYMNKKGKVVLKKETLWKNMDISKWELSPNEEIDKVKIYQDKVYAMEKMCCKETLELSNINHLLGYFYSKNGETFWAMINSNKKRYEFNMTGFSDAFEPTLTDAINIWSNFTSNIKLS